MANEQNIGSGRNQGLDAPESGMGASEGAFNSGAPEQGLGASEGALKSGAPEQGMGATEGALGSGAPQQGLGKTEGVAPGVGDGKGEFGVGSGKAGGDQRRGSGVGRFVEKIKGKFSSK